VRSSAPWSRGAVSTIVLPSAATACSAVMQYRVPVRDDPLPATIVPFRMSFPLLTLGRRGWPTNEAGSDRSSPAASLGIIGNRARVATVTGGQEYPAGEGETVGCSADLRQFQSPRTPALSRRERFKSPSRGAKSSCRAQAPRRSRTRTSRCRPGAEAGVDGDRFRYIIPLLCYPKFSVPVRAERRAARSLTICNR